MERPSDEIPRRPYVSQAHAGAASSGGVGHTRRQFSMSVGVEDDDPSKWANGIGLHMEGPSSASSSLSGNISPASDDPFRHSLELGGRLPAAYDGLWLKDHCDLLESLCDLHVQDEREAGIRQPATRLGGVATRSPVFDDAHRAFLGSFPQSSSPFEDERRSSVFGSQQHMVPDLWDSWMGETHRSNPPVLYPYDSYSYPEAEGFIYEMGVLDSMYHYSDGGLGRNSYHGSIRGQDLASSVHRPPVTGAYLQPEQNGVNQNSGFLTTSSPSPPHRVHPMQHYGPNITVPRCPSSRNIEASNCKNGFTMQGRGLHRVESNGRDLERERRRGQLDDGSNTRGSPTNLDSPRVHSDPLPPLKYEDLLYIKDYIFDMAQDQHGCRLLQQIFDEGEARKVDVVFKAVIDHVAELMVNPFGNYLMQKLLEKCSEEQKMRIILVLTEDPAELIRMSLNTHGTRAMQKLIEKIKTRQQIALVIAALKPGCLDLIKDLNGNHVIQRCLQSLPTEDNKFIFDVATKHCVDIATHRHGCVVMQRCIDYSSGEHRVKLVTKIADNGYRLAQDAFGNYVVQYILELGNRPAIANLTAQFQGNYVQLSTQKFSSNVVEKCLKVFWEEDRARIIAELLSVPRFDQLMQDPYANYVIQSALGNTKGSLHAALVRAIRPHAAVLRTSPYCKRIFNWPLLKK